MLKLRKTTKLVLVAVTLLLVYLLLFAVSPLHLFSNRYRQSVLLNLQVLFLRLTELLLLLDTNSHFQEQLASTCLDKFADKSAQDLFFLRPGYTPPVEIEAPRYYTDGQPPLVQPHDPRFTLAVYLNWIRKHPDKPVPFHWSDWVDLSELHEYILSDTKPLCKKYDISGEKDLITDSQVPSVDKYCKDDELFPLGYRVFTFPYAHTRDNAKMLAKSFLYLLFALPTKLVFLTNSHGSYEVEVADYLNNDVKNGLLQNGMVADVISSETSKLNPLKAYKKLLAANPSKTSQLMLTETQINLKPTDFEVDAKKEIKELSLLKKPTRMETNYKHALEFTIGNKDPGKSFNEAKFLNLDGLRVFGEHHDWRFFNGLTLFSDRQVIVLHRLIKNYLQFCRAHGLVTWVAHGLLLLWYWNGISFPWDADTDVQMPIRDLHKLARNFNQSLVIENVGHDADGIANKDIEFNGMGVYFVDVGSSITERTKGNGNNNIDARFIDVATGLYVDITGLSVSNETAPKRYDYTLALDPRKKALALKAKLQSDINTQKQVYNCRNRHFSSLTELSPLVLAGVQNQLGYIPQNFGMTLDAEYGLKGFFNRHFQDYTFLHNLRVWVRSNVVLDYLKIKKEEEDKDSPKKRGVNDGEAKDIENLTAEDHLSLLKNNWLLREYLVSRNFTLRHEKQMKLFLKGSMRLYGRNIKKFANSAQANTALWGDLFMHKIGKNGWDYGSEVAKILDHKSTSVKDEKKD